MKKITLFIGILLFASTIMNATISGTAIPTNASSSTICNGSVVLVANNVISGDYITINCYKLNLDSVSFKPYNTVATYTVTNLCVGNYFATIISNGLSGNDTVTVNFVISSPTVTTTPTSTLTTTTPVLYDTSLTYSDSVKVDTLINQINTCLNMYNSVTPIRIAHTVYIQDSIRVTWKYDNSTDSINTTYKYSRYGVYRIMAILWCSDTTGIGLRSTTSATITFVSDIYINPNAVTTNTTTGIESMKGSTLVIYPNPSSGLFTIYFDSETTNSKSIVITDLLGQMVYESEMFQQKVNVELLNLQGVYFITLVDRNRNTTETQRIIIQ